jgi:hypothetical protein
MPPEPQREEAPPRAPILTTPEPYKGAGQNSSLQRSLTALEQIETAGRWAKRKEWFEGDLARHKFNISQLRLLLELGRHSYGRCQATAIYSTLGRLSVAAGLDIDNLARVIDTLLPEDSEHPKGIGVVLQKRNEHGYEFQIQSEASLWRNIRDLRTRPEYEANQEENQQFASNAERHIWLLPPEKGLLEAAAEITIPQLEGLRRSNGQPGFRAAPQFEGSTHPGKAEHPAQIPQFEGSQLAATGSNKSNDLKLAAVSGEEAVEAALKWLTETDRASELKQRGAALFAAEWFKLCSKEPDYVLSDLRPSLLRRMKSVSVPKPIAWMAQKARANGKFDLRSSP